MSEKSIYVQIVNAKNIALFYLFAAIEHFKAI